jgi:hypothetical protein
MDNAGIAWESQRATELYANGELVAALDVLQQGVERRPDDHLLWAALSAVLITFDRAAEALEAVQRALTLVPDGPGALWARVIRGMALLKLGRWEGWSDVLRRWELSPWTGWPQTPPWDGQGRPEHLWLIAHPSDGLGDCLQELRFIPFLQERVGTVHVWAHQDLHPLIRTSFPDVHLTGAPDPDRVGVATAAGPPVGTTPWLPLCGLAPRLCASMTSVPTQPYLRPNPALIAWAREWLATLPRPRLGLCWHCKLTAPLPNLRTIDRHALHTLLTRFQTFTWLHLHPESLAPEELAALPGLRLVPPCPDPLAPPLAQFAAIISQLDYVVTVDTAILHLAGALGCPTLVLLSRYSDWRWLEGADRTPWYATVRVVRSPIEPGARSLQQAWMSVIDLTSAVLQNLAAR